MVANGRIATGCHLVSHFEFIDCRACQCVLIKGAPFRGEIAPYMVPWALRVHISIGILISSAISQGTRS